MNLQSPSHFNLVGQTFLSVTGRSRESAEARIERQECLSDRENDRQKSLSYRNIIDGVWDCIVIGAGCAGAVAARELARSGFRVLLVEKEKFPRYKVCGGCLGYSAIQLFQQIGITNLGIKLASPTLKSLRWRQDGSEVVVDLPGGISVSREILDAELVRLAVLAGAGFVDQTTAEFARCEDAVAVLNLRSNGESRQVKSKIILASDGLGGMFVRDLPSIQTTISSDSRMGIGTIIQSNESLCADGEIRMFSSAHGYVGIVEVENKRFNIASAIEARFVQLSGSVGKAVDAIIEDESVSQAIAGAIWKGTPLLTRRRSPLGARRVFLLGDSCGYVEPFTGEGMTWAIASAIAVVEIAQRAIAQWDDSLVQQWTARHDELIGEKQKTCSWVASGLRDVPLANSALQLARALPGLARRAVEYVHSPLMPIGEL